jgi:hypothetical protein
LKSLLIGGWEEGEGGGASGGCEDERFVVAEVDAVGIAEFIEMVKEVGDVGVVKEGSGVVMVREAIGLRLIASSCAGSDVGVELAEDEVEGEGGKDSAEGAALCKAFELLEEGPEEVGCEEPASVRFIVEKVEEGYEA